MNKKNFLLAILILLLFGAAFAVGFEQVKKAAARQKIRPELLRAVDAQIGEGQGIAPMHSGQPLAEAIKVKNGKVKVLLNLSNETELDNIAGQVNAKGGIVKGKFAAGKTIAAEIALNKIEQLAENSAVKAIWPDFEVTALDEPLQQIHAQSAWDLNLFGEGKRIAVLDTGIDATHPALAGKVTASKNFSLSATTTDVFGHGTHVAGIIAGSGQVQGVAPQAMLLNAKVLDDNGSGTASSVIAGINWAIEQKANVINLSLGAPIAENDTPLNQAVRDAIAQGVMVAIAAGNCGYACPSSTCNGFTGVTMPGNTAEAITVGAVDSANNVACFSSGGVIEGEIKPDVVAPGVAIVSSIPGGTGTKSGTSMATPFTTATAALVLQQHPEFTAGQVKQFLEQTAFDLGAEGEDAVYGWGLIDLSKIEQSLLPQPDQNKPVPPDSNRGSDVNFAESGFVFQSPDTLYKKQPADFVVTHFGTGSASIASQETYYYDTVVEFTVLDEFGNVVDRQFVGPIEYSDPDTNNWAYKFVPERVGNFTVKATIYREGLQASSVSETEIEAATAEKQVKVTVPADMLQINSFNVPSKIEQGTNTGLLLNATNNGYLDVNVVAEIQFLDEAGNIFKVIEGETKPLCNVKCHNDTECNDQNPETTDVCNNDGSCDSFCTNVLTPPPCEIACYNDSGCDDSNPGTIDVCNNDGTCESSCHNIAVGQLATGQTSEFNFNTLMDLPNGTYTVKGIVYFEDRNVSIEGQTTVFFPANCQAQDLNIAASVGVGGNLAGTIEFANNTALTAQPMFFGKVLDGNEQIGQIFFDGNSVEPNSVKQYEFNWKADAMPKQYTLRFEVQYNGNNSFIEKQFSVMDMDKPVINSIEALPSVALNQFNPIKVKAFDSTGVARVNAIIVTPSKARFVLELKQTGFDQNSEWSTAFNKTNETGNYFALIRAIDAYWHFSLFKVLRFTVTPAPSECAAQNILLVAADNGFTVDYSNEFSWLEQAAQNNKCMQMWKKSVHGNLDLNYLQKFNTIIWATENRYGENIDENDSQLLISYVNTGGRLLLEGSDIASEHLGDELMQQIAGAAWNSEPGPNASDSLIAFATDSFMAGQPSSQLDLNKTPFFDTLSDLNNAKALAYIGSEPAMTYSQNYSTKSKTIFSAIAFNALNETDRTLLLNNSIEWLLAEPDTPPTVQIYYPTQAIYSKGISAYIMFKVQDRENKQPLKASIYLDADTDPWNGNEHAIAEDLNLFNGFICWGYDFNTGKNCSYSKYNQTQIAADGQYHYLITVNDAQNTAIAYSNYPITIDSMPPTTTTDTNGNTLAFTCNDGSGSGCQKISYRAFAEKNTADPTLLGYWKLDEDQSNIMQDYSGKGNNGTVHSNSYRYYVTSAAANGKALYFNGTTFIEMPALEPTNKTLTAWIYPFSYYTGSQTIAGTTNTANKGGYYLGTANSAINATAFDTAGNSVTASTPLVFLRQQVTMVHDADNNKLLLYINGEKKAETTINGYMNANNSFYLGTNAAGSQRFRGYMDETALYSRALSAAEIKEMYEKEKNGFWSNVYLNSQNSIAISLNAAADYNAGYYSYDKTGNKETEKSTIISIN